MAEQPQSAVPLTITTPEGIRQELALIEPKAIQVVPAQDSALDAVAEDYARKLIAFGRDDVEAQERTKQAVLSMGAASQHRAGQFSRMLDEPIHTLAKRGEDGGPVANALVDLKMNVEELDPARFDFEAGWFSRMVGWVPGVGQPLKRYFTKYESTKTVIDAILNSLGEGKKQLLRDNGVLLEDQKGMRQVTLQLEQVIKLGQLIDQKLERMLSTELAQDEFRKEFVKSELLFPLRQRIVDLQQQLAVTQQGVLATELIIRNNRELVRGVDRAQNVTVYALQVAATVAMALAHQKNAIDKIEAINETTSELISHTAEQLRTQGAEIHKQASTAQLDVEALKSAFADIHAAMDDIARFRSEALPQMAGVILDMDQMTTEAEDKIRRMEAGNRATAAALLIDIDAPRT
ncbi:toxic anion resistance protein [Syntrophobacter fumaroxidans]|uniref:Toxic anion resistance family protein n=1 Tax=Syntrophobacter fumaroxidans (strain DSM 10017 / MPOB) TaxID=335543 RepID=A0LP12_SYNFM|nr:toxic anion resistance protein [Syntrophobacter fumaroxidans]ABK19164.1 toxic anion resistance family protein [Syntrophobacter fumaroxidans MPOB]